MSLGAVRLLFDENVPPRLYLAVQRNCPAAVVRWVGHDEGPTLGTLDPRLLEWCEEQDCVLVTLDQSTMPAHLERHLASGRHSPGVVIVSKVASLQAAIADLMLILGASTPEDWRDRVEHLPL